MVHAEWQWIALAEGWSGRSQPRRKCTVHTEEGGAYREPAPALPGTMLLGRRLRRRAGGS